MLESETPTQTVTHAQNGETKLYWLPTAQRIAFKTTF